LGLKPQTAATLLVGAHAQLGDEFSLGHCVNPAAHNVSDIKPRALRAEWFLNTVASEKGTDTKAGLNDDPTVSVWPTI
jgi:hypothetical protein